MLTETILSILNGYGRTSMLSEIQKKAGVFSARALHPKEEAALRTKGFRNEEPTRAPQEAHL